MCVRACALCECVCVCTVCVRVYCVCMCALCDCVHVSARVCTCACARVCVHCVNVRVYMCALCVNVCMCVCECVRVCARVYRVLCVAVAMLTLGGHLAGSPVQAVGVWEGSRMHRHCLDGWLGCPLWLCGSVASGLSLSISNQLQAVLTLQVHRPCGEPRGLTAPTLMPQSVLSHPPPSLLLMD